LVTGPSGVGKGTLLDFVLDRFDHLEFSVSCTTRPRRPEEVDGGDYHFLDVPQFEEQRDAGAFVEWALVHDNLYGTRKSDVEAMLARGLIPVLDVDVQGGLNVLRHYGDRVVSVFVFPPSWEELERRLRDRATDTDEAIATRLRNARREVTFATHYGYYLVNDDLDRARNLLCSIVLAESIRRARWPRPPLEP
jgi:guanylate kinase